MKRLLIAITVIAAVVVAVVLLRPSRPNQGSATIKIGVLRHESSLPIYVADQLGFFRDAGLTVQLVEVPPGDHMPALISGRVDILSPTSFPVLFGVMSRNPGLLYAVFPGAEVSDGPTVYGLVISIHSTASRRSSAT